MKTYKINIAIYLQAKDENDALGVADNLAGIIEGDRNYRDIECNVGKPKLAKE